MTPMGILNTPLDTLPILEQIESSLSKYTLNEEPSQPPSLEASPPPLTSATAATSPNGDTFLDTHNGLIHGHVHNFDNFTYIHGHIHTNDSLLLEPPMDVIEDRPAFRRRSSQHHHHHHNDSHSSQFMDCQHFEFLNCHDSQSNPVIVEDLDLTCDEDENCKPKILEICCDNPHQGDSFIPNLLPELVATSSHPNDEKTFEHCNFEDCIDVRCDLDDTCDIDELYCRYCENLDDLADDTKLDNKIPIQTENDEVFDQIFGTPGRSKRGREDDEKEIHHHSHHHTHHVHPENHHHHHIQLHDHHHSKKMKNDENSQINFEWNFKNQHAKCEWDVCTSQFDNALLLQAHIVENHLRPEFIGEQVGYECEWRNCDYMGDRMSSLLSHINSNHNGFSADAETKIFEEKKNLLTPSPETSLEAEKVAIEEETTCKWVIKDFEGATHLCDKQFANGEDLTRHLVEDHIGSGQSVYVCNWFECERKGQEFRQRQKALRHLHTHTHYKPLQCNVCGRRFAVDTMLTQHMRTHSGEKPYKCSTCGKRFATSSSLSVHLRTHTGEKPLLCKYPGCGKRFSESSNLTKHMKIHEREYKCPCCLKSFATLKQLKSHNAKYHTDG